MSLITIGINNSQDYFDIEKLTSATVLGDFSCAIKEYNQYLTNDALRSQRLR